MFNFKLGFKYRLLLAIVFTFLGFLTLSSLSVRSIDALIGSSEQVDRLGQQQTLLNQLQLDLLQTSAKLDEGLGSADDLSVIQTAFIARLQQSPLMKTSNQQLIDGLTSWDKTQNQRLALVTQLEDSSENGVKNGFMKALDELENALFVIFRKPFQRYRLTMLEMMKTGDAGLAGEAEQHMAALVKTIKERQMEEYLAKPLEKVQQGAAELIRLLSNIQTYKAEALKTQLQLQQRIQEDNADLTTELLTARSQAKSSSSEAIQQILLGGGLVALLVLALLLITWRQATATLTKTVQTLEQIAAGDFTHKLSVQEGSTDEFDRLGQAVNHLTGHLSQALDKVSHSSTQVQDMTGQLQGTLQKLAKSNEETGAQAQTVASAVEQISCTVLQMSGATDEAHQQATQACETADASGTVITTALSALDQLGAVFTDLNRRAQSLESASSRVDGVTEMINNLAEQTNLLALNAAIEAARAGEAGRGFSVVADEVRALAEKTVQATSDINQIVDEMKQQLGTLMKAMNAGADQVNQSQSLSDQAVAEIDKIKVWVQQVSASNTQLAANINDVALTAREINVSMISVADNVDKNVTHSRDVLSFAGEVSRQSADLESITQQFRCG